MQDVHATLNPTVKAGRDLIAHEHLYVFRKPEAGEKPSEYRHSVKWWERPCPPKAADRAL